MAQQKKISLELEEQIQSLAGDIYLQIEDKVSAFVATYSEQHKLTESVIEQHPHYQALETKYSQLAVNADQASADTQKQLMALQKKYELLNSQFFEKEAQLENIEQLNSAKLTDTEQVLKDKLAELSAVADKLKQTEKSNDINQMELIATKKQLAQLADEHNKLQQADDKLIKNDKAKAATLEIQNHQISELTLQLNNISGELDFFKSEHSTSSELTSQALAREQQQIQQLLANKTELQIQLTQSTDALRLSQQEQLHQQETILLLTEKQDELSAQLLTFQASLEQSKGEQSKKSNEINAINSAAEKLTVELKMANEKIAQYQHQIDVITQSSIEQENVHQQTIEKLTTKQNELSALVDSYQASVKKFEKNQHQYAQEITQLKESSSKVDHELSQANKALAQSQQELADSQNVMTSTQAQHKSELEALKQSIDKHRSELTDALATVGQYKDQVEQLNNIIAELEQNKLEQTQLAQTQDKVIAQQQLQNDTTIRALEQNLAISNKNHEEITRDLGEQILQLHKSNKENQQHIANLSKATKEYQTQVTQLTGQLTETEQHLANERQTSATIKEQTDKHTFSWNKQLDELQQQYEAVLLLVEQEKAQNSTLLKELDILKAETKSANEQTLTIQQRVKANKEKQELEYNKARETIKYLRDENLELSTKLEHDVAALEDQLREYRLRFEYAQKQLNNQK